MKNECSVPVKSCIGNHDVWGWHKENSKKTGDEPLWGKKPAAAELGLPDRYYSFDRAGWHFIILDSTFPDEEHLYIAKGAVCGAWWKGDHRGFDEGYGLIDLYDDGSIANQYVAYNWTPI